ncbi:hypothetical protein J2857_004896 [Neorhizobium galegae]|nr:hypothetical protein [Neorhizobium galegae]
MNLFDNCKYAEFTPAGEVKDYLTSLAICTLLPRGA